MYAGERVDRPQKGIIHMNNLRTERKNILARIAYLDEWEFDINMTTHLTESLWNRLREIDRERKELRERLARIEYALA